MSTNLKAKFDNDYDDKLTLKLCRNFIEELRNSWK